MKSQNTRRGQTRTQCSVGQALPDNVWVQTSPSPSRVLAAQAGPRERFFPIPMLFTRERVGCSPSPSRVLAAQAGPREGFFPIPTLFTRERVSRSPSPSREKVGEARMRGYSRFLRPWREKVGEARMRGYKNRHAELVSASHRFYRGFTLIEILVVVLIIGILGAIALPQYQRAVLKSRYSGMMPIAKALAEANEVFYLEHGEYSDNAENLPVQGRNNYPNGTEIELGTASDYSYVLATNPGVGNNTYIVYQKHSANFAGNIHCEALTTDEKANQVCVSFGGTPIDGSLSGDDYTTYLLSGNSTGTFEKECKTEPQTEKLCDSECGILTREATCNTSTGEWEYSEWDGNCPQKPSVQQTCGTGTKTRNVTCKSDGSGWEEGEWDISGCHINCPSKKPDTTRTSSSTSFCGTQTRTVGDCDYTTGKWEVGPWQGKMLYSNTQGVTDLSSSGSQCIQYDITGCSNGQVQTTRKSTTTQQGWQIPAKKYSIVEDPSCPSGCAQVSETYYCTSYAFGSTPSGWRLTETTQSCMTEHFCCLGLGNCVEN